METRPLLSLCAGAALAWAAAAGACLGQAPQSQPPVSPYATMQSCMPDIAERERLMTLDVATFDRSESGWRAYATAHCYSQAAALISTYLDSRQSLKADDQSILRYHAGQMLADANRDDDAASELEVVMALEPQRPHPDQGWTLYIQGTMNFLRQDRPGLDKAAGALDAYAKAEAGQERAGDLLNLNALHGLQRCFGKGYAYAYTSADCRDFDEAARLNRILDTPGG